jgi:hemoglobin
VAHLTGVDASRSERRAQIVQAIVDKTGVDEDTIRKVVHAFYGKVRQDAFIGPIFARAIGEDWDPHLAKMCDFWSSVLLMSGRYKGNPMVAHMRLKTVRPDHFARWLELFHQTAREICAPETAEAFVMRSENIARSLQLGMFYRPGTQDVAKSGRQGAK